jgi:hypothetical protein
MYPHFSVVARWTHEDLWQVMCQGKKNENHEGFRPEYFLAKWRESSPGSQCFTRLKICLCHRIWERLYAGKWPSFRMCISELKCYKPDYLYSNFIFFLLGNKINETKGITRKVRYKECKWSSDAVFLGSTPKSVALTVLGMRPDSRRAGWGFEVQL